MGAAVVIEAHNTTSFILNAESAIGMLLESTRYF
jgi:hypothetical protein